MKTTVFKYLIFTLFILINISTYSCIIDSIQCVNESLQAIETINQICSKFSDDSHEQYNFGMGIIDSICNSKKTTFDYYAEGKILSYAKILDLGNDLEYRCHDMGNLEVCYVLSRKTGVIKIKFKYWLDAYERLVDDSVTKKLFISNCLCPLKFGVSENMIKYFIAVKILLRNYNSYKQRAPNVLMDITDELKKERYTKELEYVNDPINQFDYGFSCSIDGLPPKGSTLFSYLVFYKHFDVIEKLLYSPNPVTRLHACNALEYSKKEYNYELNDEIIKRIGEIKNEEEEILTCDGCIMNKIRMKEAYLKIKDDRENYFYKHSIFFPADEEDFNIDWLL